MKKALYMSRETIIALWREAHGTDPDLFHDLYWGGLEILRDDRMPFGEARLEDAP